MTRCAVLLRGINVGRNNRLSMPDFRAALDGLGCHDVSTYLQSGNALVRAEPAGLAARVEQALRDSTHLDVRVVVRTADELADVVTGNPFPDRVDQPKRLHVVFLGAQPTRQELNGLGSRHGSDELAVGDRALYLAYAGDSHRSPLEKALRRLDVVQTARNWTTVTALLELARRP